MNNATLQAYRTLYGKPSSSGDYCVIDKNRHMVMGWLSYDRAMEYSIYYKDSLIITMEQFELNKAK